MTHADWIRATFNVLADNGKTSLLFVAEGETCCEINGQPFACHSVEEFWELVEFFGEDEDFAE